MEHSCWNSKLEVSGESEHYGLLRSSAHALGMESEIRMRCESSFARGCMSVRMDCGKLDLTCTSCDNNKYRRNVKVLSVPTDADIVAIGV